MVSLATTQLSSKGQVVIPQEVRDRLGLKPGSRFVVVAEPGVVIFKTIEPPDPGAFEQLIATARRKARRAGMKPRDIADSIRKVRSRA